MGPFSHPLVIDYVNRFYVPVFVSNEDVLGGKLGDHEQELLLSIRRNGVQQGLAVGTVQVYLLTPDAKVIDVMHVAKAARIENLMHMLKETSQRMKTTPGETLIPPSVTSQGPKTKDDELVLHFKAQLRDNATSFVDEWLVLKPDEWQQFVRSPTDASQREWSIDGDLAKRILVLLFPYSPDWDPDTERIEDAQMDLRVLENGDVRTLAVSGNIKRIQNLQPGQLPQPLYVEIVGTSKIGNEGRPQITLATFKANFGLRGFDGVVNSIEAADKHSVKGESAIAK